MQGWTLRSVPRQLCEAIAARGQLDCSRASRSVAATVSEDARHAGATRGGDTHMGELSCQCSQARAGYGARFRPDRASGKLESGCGRARGPARAASMRLCRTTRSRTSFPGSRPEPSAMSRSDRSPARRRAASTSTPSFLPTVWKPPTCTTTSPAFEGRRPTRSRQERRS